jgi:hypothetical protein
MVKFISFIQKQLLVEHSLKNACLIFMLVKVSHSNLNIKINCLNNKTLNVLVGSVAELVNALLYGPMGTQLKSWHRQFFSLTKKFSMNKGN